MQFVHDILTFTKPEATAELSVLLSKMEVYPGTTITGSRIASDYLDQFKTGDEITLSLVSETGKAAKRNSQCIEGIITEAGGQFRRERVAGYEDTQEQTLNDSPTGRAFMQRVQMYGRVNRVNTPPPLIVSLTAEPVARSSAKLRAWLENNDAGPAIIDEATVAAPMTETSSAVPKL
jgi:hypothetical protein